MSVPYEPFYINNDKRVSVSPISVDGVADTGISTYTAYLYSAADRDAQASPLVVILLAYVSDSTSPFYQKYTGVIDKAIFSAQPLSLVNQPATMGLLRVVASQGTSDGEENLNAQFSKRGNN